VRQQKSGEANRIAMLNAEGVECLSAVALGEEEAEPADEILQIRVNQGEPSNPGNPP